MTQSQHHGPPETACCRGLGGGVRESWLGIDPLLRAAAGAPGPAPARPPATEPRPPEQREASRMPRSFTHKMILCPIVLAVVQLSGGD